ncbi:MAG: hypothetical protein OXU20_07125 [Myxococcales bacterium]|nr:hypothetical protein [Myxococcales bacterium]
MNKPITATLLAAMLSVAACSDDDPPPPPANFSRPEDVAFVCMEMEDDEVRAVPLADCPNPREEPSDTHVLHALVTQTSTGEVAAVEMRANRTSIGVQPGRVIDSRPDIPGFTFVDVGAVPSDIVVPAEHPEFTYIASFGEKSLSALRTAAFRPQARQVRARVGDPLPLGVHPTEMVLGPRERFLYLSAPRDGVVLRVELCRECAPEQHFGAIEVLAPDVPEDSLALPAEPGLDATEAYASDMACTAQECPAEALGGDPELAGEPQCEFSFLRGPALPPPTLPAAVARDAEAGPQPSSLALDLSGCPDPDADDCRAILLAGDDNLPVIHRFELGEQVSGLPPLETRVPVRDVVVSPPVPVTPDGDEMTHYVYAIDSLDGSVLVLEEGELLTVSEMPDQRRDRIGLMARDGERALSLEIVTPGYPSADDLMCALTGLEMAAEARTPELVRGRANRLRGVFLLVGTSEGAIRVVDVHDLDLRHHLLAGDDDPPCRACPLLVRRHRPRLALDLAGTVQPVPMDGDEVALSNVVDTLAYTVDDRLLTVGPDGSNSEGHLPQLSCLPCRELSMARAFPLGDGSARVRSAASVEERAPTEDRESGPRLVTSLAGRGAQMDPPMVDAGMAEDPDTPDAGNPDAGRAEEGAGQPAACSDGHGRICSLSDPWAGVSENWQLQFEGRLPGATGREGRADQEDDETWSFRVERDHCSDGVLAGDQLVITSVPDDLVRRSWDEGSDEDNSFDPAPCRAFVTTVESLEDRRVMGFEILEAYEDRFVISNVPVGSKTTESGIATPYPDLPSSFADLWRCFQPSAEDEEYLPEIPRAMSYQVRGYRSFLVWSARTGFQHRVSSVDGRCETSASDPLTTTGRVYLPDPELAIQQEEDGFCRPGDRNFFNNGRLALCLGERALPSRPAPSRVANVALNIATQAPSPRQRFSAGSLSFSNQFGVLPLSMRYSETDLRVYMVDPQIRGLLPIPLDSFPAALPSNASHFN